MVAHFFESRATQQALEAVSTASPLVLFLGAGVSASMRIPSWQALLRALLFDVAAQRDVPNSEREAFVDILLSSSQADALGSIVRRAFRGPQSFEERLRKHLYSEASPSASGTSTFVRAVCNFLITRERADLETVVITTNYDDLIETAFEHDPLIRSAAKQLRLRVKPVWGGSSLRASRSTLPIYHIHGFLPQHSPAPRGQRIVLSSADYGENWQEHWSFRVLDPHVQAQWLFVGMSFNDMHINFHLAQRKLQQERRSRRAASRPLPSPVGILSTQGKPWQDLGDGARKRLQDVEVARLKELGLEPLATNYYFEDAQFLREALLRISHPEAASYLERRRDWKKGFQTVITTSPSMRDAVVEKCRLTLLAIRGRLEEFAGDSSELFKVELWCRFWGGGNQLFQLASSEYHSSDVSRAPRHSLSANAKMAATECFKNGTYWTTPPPDTEPVESTSPHGTSRWVCFSGVPVVLDAPPWFGFPVGALVLGATAQRPVTALIHHRPDIEAELGRWLSECKKLLDPGSWVGITGGLSYNE